MSLPGKPYYNYLTNPALGRLTITAGGRRNTRRLEELARALPQRAARVSKVHAELVRFYAIAFAPKYEQPPSEPGNRYQQHDITIREGIVVKRLTATRYDIISTAPHSAAQEYGARPHDIRPVETYQINSKGNLSNLTRPTITFFGSGNNQFVTMKVVHHPGNPPHPFMMPARRRVAAVFYKELRRMFEDNAIPWKVMA